MGNSQSNDAAAMEFSREAAKRAGREAFRRVKTICDQKLAEIESVSGPMPPPDKEAWEKQTKETALAAARKAGRAAAELAVEKFQQQKQGTRGLGAPSSVEDFVQLDCSDHLVVLRDWRALAVSETRARSLAAAMAAVTKAADENVPAEQVIAISKDKALDEEEERYSASLENLMMTEAKTYLHTRMSVLLPIVNDVALQRACRAAIDLAKDIEGPCGKQLGEGIVKALPGVMQELFGAQDQQLLQAALA
mmetsp:Transcript_32014/g.80306  ORF Transcript_32014/g.80306 Transcript_32014/m.80306 type:complete len:250 (-) Transcript_32014:230-979(-)